MLEDCDVQVPQCGAVVDQLALLSACADCAVVVLLIHPYLTTVCTVVVQAHAVLSRYDEIMNEGTTYKKKGSRFCGGTTAFLQQ